VSLKSFLAYTNPIFLVGMIPVGFGIVLSVVFKNLFSNSVKVFKEVREDMEE